MAKFAPIPDLPGYVACSEGYVIGRKGKRLSEHKDAHGYPCVKVYDSGSRTLKVHRAVALAFLGKPPRGKNQVAHKDGTRDNNRVENLYWASASENAKDRTRHGRKAMNLGQGESHADAKLTDSAVFDMRSRHAKGEKIGAIARKYGVDKRTAARAIKGESWAHVPFPREPRLCGVPRPCPLGGPSYAGRS